MSDQKVVKFKPLSAKYQAFGISYADHGNASQAARDAGYAAKSAKTTGLRLKKNKAICAFVERIRAELEQSAGITSEWVLDKLKAIVEHCTRLGRTYNPAAANKALELIGKHLGTFEPDAKDQDQRPAFVGISINFGPKPSVELTSANAKNKDVPLLTDAKTDP